jgi:hypothetical protein
MTRKSEVLRKWQLRSPYLHRKQWTLWAAAEAEVIGPRGCPMLADVTGISIPTLTKWIGQLKLTETARARSLIPPKGSAGSGRKRDRDALGIARKVRVDFQRLPAPNSRRRRWREWIQSSDLEKGPAR